MEQPPAAYPYPALVNSRATKTEPEEPPIRRRSVFMEVGLVDEGDFIAERKNPTPILIRHPSPKRTRPTLKVRFRSKADIFEEDERADEWGDVLDAEDDGSLATTRLSTTPSAEKTYHHLYRLAVFALVLAVLLPYLQGNPVTGVSARIPLGARGGVIPSTNVGIVEDDMLRRREDSPTTICKRWSHQSECHWKRIREQLS
jgi:hypothetical protein